MIARHDGKMIVKMKGLLFVRMLIRLYGKPWMWLFLLFFMLGIIFSVMWDIRALLLSAMSVFILFPGVMMFLYYYYGLLSGCYSNFVWHTINLEGGDIVISYYYSEKSENNNDDEKRDKFGQSDGWNNGIDVYKEETLLESEHASAVSSYRLIKSGDIRYSTQKLSNYIVIGDGVVFPFQGAEKGFLWLPKEMCINDDGEETIFDGILKLLRERNMINS